MWDQTELERLTKAHQTSQLLLSDIREIQAKTDCVALEELMLTAIGQVGNLCQLLGRLSKQS